MEFQTNLKNTFQRSQGLATSNKKLINDIVRIGVIEEEIEYYKTLLRESDTGHIHTTIGFLNASRSVVMTGSKKWLEDNIE